MSQHLFKCLDSWTSWFCRKSKQLDRTDILRQTYIQTDRHADKHTYTYINANTSTKVQWEILHSQVHCYNTKYLEVLNTCDSKQGRQSITYPISINPLHKIALLFFVSFCLTSVYNMCTTHLQLYWKQKQNIHYWNDFNKSSNVLRPSKQMHGIIIIGPQFSTEENVCICVCWVI